MCKKSSISIDSVDLDVNSNVSKELHKLLGDIYNRKIETMRNNIISNVNKSFTKEK